VGRNLPAKAGLVQLTISGGLGKSPLIKVSLDEKRNAG